MMIEVHTTIKECLAYKDALHTPVLQINSHYKSGCEFKDVMSLKMKCFIQEDLGVAMSTLQYTQKQ